MRDLISNVGTDYAAFACTGLIVLVFTLIYLWWVSSNYLTYLELVFSWEISSSVCTDIEMLTCFIYTVLVKDVNYI